MTIPERKCKVQINYHPLHHHKLSWQCKSNVHKFFPNRSMNTTKQREDNRNLVAECTLASLLQQRHAQRSLSGFSGMQEAPAPPQTAPIWGAKVVSQGKRRLHLSGKGIGTGLWAALALLPHVTYRYFFLSWRGRLTRRWTCRCRIISDPLALRISFDAFVQIITKFVHCFLCTASTK